MAKVRVLGTPKLPILEIKQAVNADLAKNNSEEAVRLVMSKMQPIAQEHFNNAVRQVALKLRGLGIPAGVTSDGPRTISYGKVGGGTGVFKTKPWKALTEKYRRRHYNKSEGGWVPASYKFWIKTGTLSNAVNAMARQTFKVRMEEQKSKRNHHKNRINTTVRMGVDPLPFPFERAITVPFILTSDVVTMKDLSEPVNRNGLGRARFAEQGKTTAAVIGGTSGRPFLRKLSSYLGRQMRTDLTKKLRKL